MSSVSVGSCSGVSILALHFNLSLVSPPLWSSVPLSPSVLEFHKSMKYLSDMYWVGDALMSTRVEKRSGCKDIVYIF